MRIDTLHAKPFPFTEDRWTRMSTGNACLLRWHLFPTGWPQNTCNTADWPLLPSNCATALNQIVGPDQSVPCSSGCSITTINSAVIRCGLIMGFVRRWIFDANDSVNPCRSFVKLTNYFGFGRITIVRYAYVVDTLKEKNTRDKGLIFIKKRK